MSENPLKKNSLAVSPTAEAETEYEIVDATQTSLLDLQRRQVDIAERQKELNLARKEGNLDSVKEITDNLEDAIKAVSDPAVIQRVMGSVKSGKEFNEAVKGVQGLAQLRDDMLDRTYDDGSNSGKKKRIAVAFQGQGVKLQIGVETDG